MSGTFPHPSFIPASLVAFAPLLNVILLRRISALTPTLLNLHVTIWNYVKDRADDHFALFTQPTLPSLVSAVAATNTTVSPAFLLLFSASFSPSLLFRFVKMEKTSSL